MTLRNRYLEAMGVKTYYFRSAREGGLARVFSRSVAQLAARPLSVKSGGGYWFESNPTVLSATGVRQSRN